MLSQSSEASIIGALALVMDTTIISSASIYIWQRHTWRSMKNIRLGSCFSGIGGFELGLHWAIPNLSTQWQIEQNAYCQGILRKHWPDSKIYNDIQTINTAELSDIDMLCGGFPCQNISNAGLKNGIHGEKSGLFWSMLRIIGDFRDQGRKIPILLLENVAAITLPNRGLSEVLGSISQIGYSIEYFTLKASDFGAPHQRERWFAVAYSNSNSKSSCSLNETSLERDAPNSNSKYSKKQPMYSYSMGKTHMFKRRSSQNNGKNCRNYWKKGSTQSPLCSVDDGISDRLARLKSLGNAIVPQCSEWIGERLIETGLIRDILGAEYVY